MINESIFVNYKVANGVSWMVRSWCVYLLVRQVVVSIFYTFILSDKFKSFLDR